MRIRIPLVLLTLAAAAVSAAAPVEGDFDLPDFHFESGQSLARLRMHYRLLGSPRRDEQGVTRNAVLVLHGTTGSGAQFLRPEFAGQLFGAGQPLDASRYFLILVDNIGHGQSGKPSDGLRAQFPNYRYRDMVAAQYRLLTEGLQVNHLRLIFGTSMGGMQTWLWGEIHPDFMDALMPMACLPTQISGRNRVWRRVIIDSIRGAPDWQDGNYQAQPYGLRLAAEMLYFMSENPAMRFKETPTLQQVDSALNGYVTRFCATSDANNILYAVEASADYDPGPALEKITAPLLAINTADDLINPPDLGILGREIKRVPNGRAILIPESEQTVGHGSHTRAVLWKKEMEEFLHSTDSHGRMK